MNALNNYSMKYSMFTVCAVKEYSNFAKKFADGIYTTEIITILMFFYCVDLLGNK